MENKKISVLTGYTIRRISYLLNEYLQNGIGYFLEEHRKGGNRRNLNEKEDAEILNKFREKAEKGQYRFATYSNKFFSVLLFFLLDMI